VIALIPQSGAWRGAIAGAQYRRVAEAQGYRFAGFVVSCRRRQVLRAGVPLPLIPRYFDLLVLLLERRHTVVTRREIFDEVWGDVIVSDGALTQAIRTLRRMLGDDSREPVFIRTISRHGYSFVFADVEEGDEEACADRASPRHRDQGREEPGPAGDVDTLMDRLFAADDPAVTLEDRRDAAEQLHALGTDAALARLMARPGHADALALMRDSRWDVPGAGPVPLWLQPEGLSAARRLVQWRARDALRVTRRRWAQAAGGAAGAGAAAGLVGGALLTMAPGSTTPARAIPVLMVLGAVGGFTGAAGVAAGIAAAEAVARSRRSLAILIGGSLGGLAIGAFVQAVVGWTLESVFGLRVQLGGSIEGLFLGAAIAAGYAATTSLKAGGIAAPSGRARWRTAGACALASGLAAIGLSLSGAPLVGGTINAVAQASAGSQVALAPLGNWIGEPAFGPLTRTLVAAAEGALFGFGLAWGLTRRTGGRR
jgi:DNA-binding winged helix-turn-helix (wHTH) protein